MQSLSGPFPHFALELFAYFVGAQIYWRMARAQAARQKWQERFFLLAGAVGGAALGSKGLHVLEHLPALMQTDDLKLWVSGKSVVGGFIGGTLGVEMAKRAIGWSGSTGDAWVPALAVGLLIGRVGCQLSGTWDHTYGVPTALPWAWDYGDGISRHPTALYEIILVALLLPSVWILPALRLHPGARFAAFLVGYCTIRFGLEFLKPPFGVSATGTLPVALYQGLTAIQWACVAGVVGYLFLLRFRLRPGLV
jgi:phosphatidylglycerol:prolipoprotein diacylglycerol transferase